MQAPTQGHHFSLLRSRRAGLALAALSLCVQNKAIAEEYLAQNNAGVPAKTAKAEHTLAGINETLASMGLTLGPAAVSAMKVSRPSIEPTSPSYATSTTTLSVWERFRSSPAYMQAFTVVGIWTTIASFVRRNYDVLGLFRDLRDLVGLKHLTLPTFTTYSFPRGADGRPDPSKLNTQPLVRSVVDITNFDELSDNRVLNFVIWQAEKRCSRNSPFPNQQIAEKRTTALKLLAGDSTKPNSILQLYNRMARDLYSTFFAQGHFAEHAGLPVRKHVDFLIPLREDSTDRNFIVISAADFALFDVPANFARLQGLSPSVKGKLQQLYKARKLHIEFLRRSGENPHDPKHDSPDYDGNGTPYLFARARVAIRS